jgi:hypothetical protein
VDATKLQNRIARRIETATSEIAEFQNELAKDPMYAFRWSEGTLQVAARLSCYQTILTVLAAGKTVNQVKALLARKVVEMAKSPSMSTSPMQNLMYQYEMAAWATLLTESEDWE